LSLREIEHDARHRSLNLSMKLPVPLLHQGQHRPKLRSRLKCLALYDESHECSPLCLCVGFALKDPAHRHKGEHENCEDFRSRTLTLSLTLALTRTLPLALALPLPLARTLPLTLTRALALPLTLTRALALPLTLPLTPKTAARSAIPRDAGRSRRPKCC
jgi:hypothetical protein